MNSGKIRTERNRRGRGTVSKVDPRYLDSKREKFDDGWETDEEPDKIQTHVSEENARSIISRNQSPDIPFEQSVNPYRGCEHGCNYCYARPSHAYLDLSPGIDFETRLFAKTNAAELLERELAKTSYQCKPLALGTNTDPYQPIERKYAITREIVALLKETHHPLTIVTKSHSILRDVDLLSDMAQENLVQVHISVTTLDATLAKSMEPRASAPFRRLETIERLSAAGVPTGLMFAPVIPWINDSEMEDILGRGKSAGARFAGYVMLRLPLELSEIFRAWLEDHYPLKKDHVMSMIQNIRDGKDYNSSYHNRMRGSGVYSKMIRQRFESACKKNGLNTKRLRLSTEKFTAPVLSGSQQSLF